MRDNPEERRRRIQLEELDRIELGRVVADALRRENSHHTKREMSVSQMGTSYITVRDRAVKAVAQARLKLRSPEPQYGKPFTPEERQGILLSFPGKRGGY